MASYVVGTYRLPADLEEVVVALLWGEGCQGVEELGIEEGLSTLEAYFPEGQGTYLPPVPGVELLERRDLVEQDWLETYRRLAQPIEVGRHFVIDPREPDEPVLEPVPHRRTLRLPARQAFGTGSHESTRLILELMEEAPLKGARVLDVGSGSGILSFAALVLGARTVQGFDFDLPSAFLSGQYRSLNGLFPSFFAGRLDALSADAGFEILLVNILPERILPQAHQLPAMLREDGEILLSGILRTRGSEVLAAMAELGFRPIAERTAGDWIAYRCRR